MRLAVTCGCLAVAAAAAANDLLREVYGDLAELADFLSVPEEQDTAAFDSDDFGSDGVMEGESFAMPQQYGGAGYGRYPASPVVGSGGWGPVQPAVRPAAVSPPMYPPTVGGYPPVPSYQRPPSPAYGGMGTGYYSEQDPYARLAGGDMYPPTGMQPMRPTPMDPSRVNDGRSWGTGGRGVGAGVPPSVGRGGGMQPARGMLRVPPSADIIGAPPSSLEAFVGRWEVDPRTSRPLDAILSALGVAPLKIRILDNHSPVTTIYMASPNALRMENRLPGGSSVGGNVPLDGSEFVHTEQETGSWRSVAEFDGRKLAQVRHSQRGTMYDIRAVFDRHPQTGAPGPWMLFKWSFQPNAGQMVSADRWLHKIG